MGKPKNNAKRKESVGSKYIQRVGQNKKRKFERYWIEKVKEVLPSKDTESALTVVISRIDLNDDHFHAQNIDTDDIRAGDDKDETRSCTTVAVQAGVAAVTTVEGSSNTNNVAVVPDASLLVNNDSSPTVKIHFNVDNAFISLQRAPSAKAPLTKYPYQHFHPRPNGDCGDGILNPYPTLEVNNKYWAQRKRLFSRYDEGIKMDKEGWFSVTPEAIANHLASRVVKMHNCTGLVLFDAFAGCGGNAIAFARRPEVSLVLCSDTDIDKLRQVANNARVYGIGKEKIILLHCNACSVLEAFRDGKLLQNDLQSTRKTGEAKSCEGYKLGGLELLPGRIDSIFLSPPWGGMDYEQVGKRNYDIEKCIILHRDDGSTCNGEELLQLSANAQRCVLFFLPRNLDGVLLGRSALKAGYHEAIEVEQNNLNGKLKTITTYFGYCSSSLLNTS